MTDFIKERLEEAKARHRRGRTFLAGIAVLSVFAAGAVFWQLRQTGISATSDVVCGLAEHVHTEDCYETHFICGLEEGQEEAPGHTHGPECYEETWVLRCEKEPHTHGDDCYTEKQVLTCALPEHIHGEGCYDSDGTLVCTQEEHSHGEDCYTVGQVLTCTLEPHEHDESCYEETEVLTCTQEERAPVAHVHTDACRETTLTCTVPEHTHDETCLPDLTADVEDTETLRANAANPGTGIWNTDLLAVAKAQLGYRESTRNFILDDEGTRHGYTRYGESYGDPYGPWDGMFLAYCLRYSGVPEYVAPQRAGVSTMLSESAGSLWLRQGSAETAQPGDIVFFDGTAGIVSLGGETLTVICGDVSGSVAAVSVSTQSVSAWTSVSEAYSTYALQSAEQPEEEPSKDVPEDNKEEPEKADSTKSDAVGKETDKPKDFTTLEANSDTPAETPETDTTPLVLADHIRSSKLEKKQGNTYVEIPEGGTIQERDNVRLKLEYLIPADRNASKQAVYSPIPAGLYVTTNSTGTLKDSRGDDAGTYRIEGNRILFEYNDSIWNADGAFEGTFYLEGRVDKTTTGDSENISFPGFGDLVVEKRDPDLTIKKKFTAATVDMEGNAYFNYRVEYSTVNGTGTEKLTLKDQLNVNRRAGKNDPVIPAIYNSDVTITKNGAAFTQEEPYTFSWNKDDPDKPYFQFEGLDPLNPGESYVMVYSVKIPAESFRNGTGQGALYNTASAIKNGEEWKYHTDFCTFSERITKKGTYNPLTGRIRWEITVSNPTGQLGNSLIGARVRDILPEGLTVLDDVKVYGAGNTTTPLATVSAAEFMRMGYTFPSNIPLKNSYILVFETEVPTSAENGVSNTAVVELGEQSFTTRTTAQINPGQWGVTKTAGAVVGTEAHWSLYAVNSTGADTFELWDRIADGVENGISFPDTHYAIAAELQRDIEQNLQLLMVDGTVRDYQSLAEIRYYDRDNNPVDATNSTAHVQSFVLVFRKTDVNVKSVSLSDYITHIDGDAVDIGHALSIANQASFGNTTYVGNANAVYTNPHRLEKQVSSDGVNFENKISVSYGKNITLTYRLQLLTTATETEELVLTDTLPQGCSLTGQPTLTVDGIVKADGISVSLRGQTLTFRISGYNPDGVEHRIAVRYNVTVTPSADGRWNDLSLGSADYTNVVEWGDVSDSATVTVTRDVPSLMKTHGDIQMDSGDNVVEYTVYINLGKKSYNKDALILEDSLVLPEGVTLDKLRPTVDPADVHLYYYDYDEATNQIVTTQEVPTNMYKILSDPSFLLKLEVPDRTAMVLRYKCRFNLTDPGKITVSNSVSMEGVTVADMNAGVELQGHNATVSYGLLALRKVDAGTGRPLSGAKFVIEKYEKTTKTWQEAVVRDDSGKTGNGTFNVSVTGAEQQDTLQPDTLYRITEARAPENYILDATPRYILFYTTTKEAGFLAATGETNAILDANGDPLVAMADVTFCSRSQILDLVIQNSPEELTVEKLWLDADNRPSNAPEGITSITYDLKYRLKDGQGNLVEEGIYLPDVELEPDANGRWAKTYTIGTGNALPGTDENGNIYYYYVEEKNRQSNWDVSYTGSEGIRTGTLTIRNRVYSYKLPETGGRGTKAIYALGLCLMAGSAGAWMAAAKKRRNQT